MTPDSVYSQALSDLDNGRYTSIRAAAAAYKIDYTTLSRRRKGQRNRVDSHELQQTLSPLQERLLVAWLLEAERAAHAFNHAQLRDIASIILKASGGNGYVGKGWVIAFLKRNPGVRTKKGVSIANQRVFTLYSNTFKSWFEQLNSLILSKGIKPAHIWNMDETGNALGPCANQTILGNASTKRSYVSRPEDREWVSVIECISAEGIAIQPLVIFKGQHVQNQWFIPGQTPDWRYTTSPSAYTSNDIGLQWLRDIFIPQTCAGLTQGQYRLLLLDGHRSHCTLEFMWECFQHKIIPYYLVAHASHILQPLDLTVFSSLKRTYRAAVNYHSDLDDTAPVKKQRFLEHYQSARDSALTAKNAKAGFQAAGIVPWCPRKVLSSPFIIPSPSDDNIIRPSTPIPQPPPTEVTKTPTTARELYQAVTTLRTSTTLDRDTRNLFAKTIRGFDRIQFNLATTQRHLKTCKKYIDDNRARIKRKQPVDPNKTFVDIKDIKAASERITATTTTAVATTTVISHPQLPPPTVINLFEGVTAQLGAVSRTIAHQR